MSSYQWEIYDRFFPHLPPKLALLNRSEFSVSLHFFPSKILHYTFSDFYCFFGLDPTNPRLLMRPSETLRRDDVAVADAAARRIYTLIWRQFVGCQMAPATSLSVTAGALADGFHSKGQFTPKKTRFVYDHWFDKSAASSFHDRKNQHFNFF